MARAELPAWATLANQNAHKQTSEDTNMRVRGIETSVNALSGSLAGLRVGELSHCIEATCRVDSVNDVVRLRWRDPADTVVGGYTFAQWARTVIVKKHGSAPESIYDGTTVLTETTRNQYASEWFEDSQADGGEWYYRAFPIATNGNISVNTKNIFKPYTLYGFTLDTTESDDEAMITYIEDCAGYRPLSVDFATADADTDPDVVCDACDYGDWQHAFFMPRPCMLKRDGTVDYYLDPNNLYLKADGETASDIANSSYDGNAMMEFPAIFIKASEANGIQTFLFSDVKLDSGFECFPCLKSDGSYAEHFYLPIFEGTSVNNTLRSIIPNSTTKPLASTTSMQELAYARNNGAGWSTTTWADEATIRVLGLLVLGRADIQSAIGYMPGENTSALTNYVGKGAKKGMFYGHSGVSNPINTKFFGMENWYGHRWRRPQGLNLINGKYYAKLTRSTQDGSNVTDFITSDTAADYTAGYIDTGITVATDWNASFVTKIAASMLLMGAPVSDGGAGSNSTYLCDATWSSSGVRCLLCGGSCSNGFRAGLFASGLYHAPSYAFWSFGASLSYHDL